MPQIPYRANLSSAIFPLTLAKAGRTVVNPGADQNFDKRVDASGTDKSSVGIPQAMYMENVLPTSEGFQSIGYKDVGTITIPTGETINTLETLQVASTVESSTVTEDAEIVDDGSDIADYTVVNVPPYSGYGGIVDYDIFDVTYASYAAAVDNLLSSVVLFTDLFVGQTHTYALLHYINDLEVSPLQFPAYMYRYAGPLAANDVTDSSVGWNFYLSPGSTNDPPVSELWEARMDMGVGVSTTGAGLRIVYSTTEQELYINTSTGGWGAENQTTLVTVALALSNETWYRAEVVTTATDVTVTILNSSEDILAFVTEALPEGFALNDYFGMGLQTPRFDLVDATEPPNTYQPNMVAYAAIDFTAAIPDTATTILSDVVPVDFTFFSDNTASASRAELDTYENLEVEVPETFESPASSDKISFATVRGRCFAAIREAGDTTKIYEIHYDDPGYSFEDVTATIASGLGELVSIDSILGVTGSYNYLILYSKVAAFWSSTTTVTDFSASLVSGAGSEYLANLKGDITFCKSHVAGFYLYTSGNALFAVYTGNSRYPWKFREIANSGGYSFSQQVAGDTNSSAQLGIANTKSIQNLAPDGASLAAPEVSNFLERTKIWDKYNFTSNVFELLRDGGTSSLINTSGMYRIWNYLDRYLLVPYHQVAASGTYLQVLVLDVLLGRYGKLAIPHHVVTANSKSIYFFDFTSGNKYKTIFDIYDTTVESNLSAILLLGKYQLVRDRFLTLQELFIESAQDEVFEDREFSVRVFSSLDGKNFLTSTLLTPLAPSAGSLVEYKSRITGKNLSLACLGKFDLATVDMSFTVDGDS